MAKTSGKKTFEQLMAELEATVAQLEQGQLPLDELLKQYTAGLDLARQCREKLDQAETLLAAKEDSPS